MKKILGSVVCLGLLFAVAGCSKEPACTQEEITKKTTELQTAVQAAVTKDPTKAAELMTKVQEVATKYKDASDNQACKAIDELIKTVKG